MKRIIAEQGIVPTGQVRRNATERAGLAATAAGGQFEMVGQADPGRFVWFTPAFRIRSQSVQARVAASTNG